MKQDMTVVCSRVDDVEPYTAYRMGVTLEDVDLTELVSDYRSELLGAFDIEDLIKAVEEKGYRVEEE